MSPHRAGGETEARHGAGAGGQGRALGGGWNPALGSQVHANAPGSRNHLRRVYCLGDDLVYPKYEL